MTSSNVHTTQPVSSSGHRLRGQASFSFLNLPSRRRHLSLSGKGLSSSLGGGRSGGSSSCQIRSATSPSCRRSPALLSTATVKLQTAQLALSSEKDPQPPPAVGEPAELINWVSKGVGEAADQDPYQLEDPLAAEPASSSLESGSGKQRIGPDWDDASAVAASALSAELLDVAPAVDQNGNAENWGWSYLLGSFVGSAVKTISNIFSKAEAVLDEQVFESKLRILLDQRVVISSEMSSAAYSSDSAASTATLPPLGKEKPVARYKWLYSPSNDARDLKERCSGLDNLESFVDLARQVNREAVDVQSIFHQIKIKHTFNQALISSGNTRIDLLERDVSSRWSMAPTVTNAAQAIANCQKIVAEATEEFEKDKDSFKFITLLDRIKKSRTSSRSGVVLSQALFNILGGVKESAGSYSWAAERDRVAKELLPSWLEEFEFIATSQCYELLKSKIGQKALLNSLVSSLDAQLAKLGTLSEELAPETSAEKLIRFSEGRLIPTGADLYTESQKQFGRTQTFWASLIVDALSDTTFCSADEASFWLCQGTRISQANAQHGLRVEGHKSYLHAKISRVSNASLVISCLLSDISPKGNLSTLVSFAIIKLDMEWDQTLCEAILSAVKRLAPAGNDSMYLSCLPLAGRCQASEGNGVPLLQLLGLPQMQAAVGMQPDRLQAVRDQMVQAILLASKQIQVDYSPAVGTQLLDLLRFSSKGSNNIELSASSYDQVVSAALQSGRGQLALGALTIFFSADQWNPASSVIPDAAVLAGLVSSSYVQAASLGEILSGCTSNRRRAKFLAELAAVSAELRSPGWALATVQEATMTNAGGQSGGGAVTILHPSIVSSLVEVFLAAAPVASVPPGESAGCSSYDGARAALKAIQHAQHHRHWSILKLSQAARSALARYLLAHQLPAPAAEGASPAEELVGEAESEFACLQHLALDLMPSAQTATRLLLSAAHSLAGAGRLRKVLKVASENQWIGLGRMALAALRQLPPDRQTVELKEGGASALASLLALDAEAAAPASSPSAAGKLAGAFPSDGDDGPLGLLIDFLNQDVAVEALHPAVEGGERGTAGMASSARASSVASLLSGLKWQALIQQVLCVCDRSGGKVAPMAMEQARQVVAASVTAAEQRALLEAAGAARASGANSVEDVKSAGIGAVLWAVQEALTGGKQRVRQPTNLALARTLMRGLQDQGWHPTAATTSQHESGGGAVSDSASSRLVSAQVTAADEMARVYAAFISWLAGEKAITSICFPVAMEAALTHASTPGGDRSSGDASKLHTWLPDMVADMCAALSGVPGMGAQWAVPLVEGSDSNLCENGGIDAATFAAQACWASQGPRRHQVLLDVLDACPRKYQKAQLPQEMVLQTLESVSELGGWHLGDSLLHALGLGAEAWAADKARLAEELDLLDTPGQVDAVLTIIVHCCTSGPQWSDTAQARALMAVSEQLLLRASGTMHGLLRSLHARAAAAAAVSGSRVGKSALSVEGGNGAPAPSEDALDLDHHCNVARTTMRCLANEFSKQQKLSRGAADPGDGGDGSVVHAAGGYAIPTAEAYIQLMAVYGASGKPLQAAGLALEVLRGFQPLATPTERAEEGRAAAAERAMPHSAQTHSLDVHFDDVQAVCAQAMSLLNEAGVHGATLLLFEELLRMQGEVRHVGLMKQVLEAANRDPDRVVEAVGEDGYFNLEEGHPCCALKEWIHQNRRPNGDMDSWKLLVAEFNAAAPSDTGYAYADEAVKEIQPETASIIALYGGSKVMMEGSGAVEQLQEFWGAYADVRCFGSPRHEGAGPAMKLLHAIKEGCVTRVYIQAGHGSGHGYTAKIQRACQEHGIPYLSVGAGSDMAGGAIREEECRRRHRVEG